MTDQLDYTAKIRAKGLADTGVTEEIARHLYGHRGGHYMAIVEVRVDTTHDTADGQHKVDLTVAQCHVATDDRLESHLRDLTRALHNERRLHDEDEQPQLDSFDDVEPTVAQVLAARADTQPLDDDSDEPPWEYPAGEGTKGDAVSAKEREEDPVST